MIFEITVRNLVLLRLNVLNGGTDIKKVTFNFPQIDLPFQYRKKTVCVIGDWRAST